MTRPRPLWLWADEHPDACQVLLDPTIHVLTSEEGADGKRFGTLAVPAGWVPAANELHRGITQLVGDYALIQAGQKGYGLRWLTTVDHVPGVRALKDSAYEITAGLCTVCGRTGVVPNPPRCKHHPRRTTPHAMARPPVDDDHLTDAEVAEIRRRIALSNAHPEAGTSIDTINDLHNFFRSLGAVAAAYVDEIEAKERDR
ncbi:hypothetical protein [Gordonia sp. 852002-51296_SCH5728562-b]|uniref:hypothetical protein n=1 Tax=Gordonia sp. 852002-51296_SCH5728562-b TaxID=1834101 RepID=UPI0007E9895B|nr:hypothetical protein [Gordonia sp. 852002-51296_SCH5728562-b]OBA38982.1 hypothetical protein A5766_04300 [Gordonia sp. 852002-51296_SCH5728562-b]